MPSRYGDIPGGDDKYRRMTLAQGVKGFSCFKALRWRDGEALGNGYLHGAKRGKQLVTSRFGQTHRMLAGPGDPQSCARGILWQVKRHDCLKRRPCGRRA